MMSLFSKRTLRNSPYNYLFDLKSTLTDIVLITRINVVDKVNDIYK